LRIKQLVTGTGLVLAIAFLGILAVPVWAVRYTITDLGTLGGTQARPYAINTAGQVTGCAYTAGNSVTHAFLYSNGVMQDLGTLGGNNSWARGINDNGQVVGYSYLAGNSIMHAFFYSNGGIQDLGTLGGTESCAWAINAGGQISGESLITGNLATHAFLYTPGVGKQDLGTLGGTFSGALGINAAGQVVGSSQITGDSILHAFLYSGGALTDLNTLLPAGSGWVLSDASGINDSGQIVGTGINSLGEERAFVMTPVSDFNGDVTKDGYDIDNLFDAINGGSSDLKYDLNADGAVNQGDMSYMIHNVLHTHYGDADLNGEVDGDDYDLLVNGYLGID
jgi:probable HAF family extracellular repeat protein